MLRKNLLLFAILIIGLLNIRWTQNESSGEETENFIAGLLSEMTIEEKAGQMMLAAIDIVSVGEPYQLEKPHRLDTAKLQRAIVEYKIGAFQNCGGMAFSGEHWCEIINTLQNFALTKTNCSIPILYGIDAVHGSNFTLGATIFPHQIAIAATFDRNIASQVAKISAYETRASAIPLVFSPVIDVCRNPVWGRVYETFGEDPHLTSELGSAMVKAYQQQTDSLSVATCLKHFIAYGASTTGRDRTPVRVDERELREIFLPPFVEAINCGAKAIMINSGEINGIPVHANYNLLTEILRNELSFKGVTISDWDDVNKLFTEHRVANSPKEAIKMAINAGVDMAMVPFDFSFLDMLVELIKEGEILEQRIDEAVGRILRLKMELGLFTKNQTFHKNYSEFASAEAEKINLNAAIDAITLLKNNKAILPLPKNAKVLVTGPAANSMRCLNGGWTYSWQGDFTDSIAANENTIFEAIIQNIENQNVEYVEGCNFNHDINTAMAVKKAAKVDYIIACLGENSYTEMKGNISDLYISEAQTNFILELSKTGKPIILILVEGRPRIISKFEAKTDAILLAYLLGNQGGNAIAKVLFGDATPCGRLPFTYPRYPNALLTYDYKYTEITGENFAADGYNPQFAFGHGLSYTKFQYSNLTFSKTTFYSNETLTVSVDVTNVGKSKGKEAVLLYISDLYASITPSVKQLKAFEKIELQCNETKTISFQIDKNTVSLIDAHKKRITEAGDFVIQIENLSDTITYQSL